jgi:hypothetical protein
MVMDGFILSVTTIATSFMWVTKRQRSSAKDWPVPFDVGNPVGGSRGHVHLLMNRTDQNGAT